MKTYLWFNLVCIGCCGLFAIGTLWQWRFLFVKKPVDTVAHIETIAYGEVETLDEQAVETREPTEDVADKDETVTIEENGKENVVDEVQKREGTPEAFNELQKDTAQIELNLDVPFTSQAPERNWDQPWQDACEEVALLMLDAYYKGYGLSPLFVKDEVKRMVAWEEERGWGGSIAMSRVERMYKEYFKSDKTPRIVENPTVEQIKTFLKQGKPVLVVADGKTLPNPWYSNGGPVYHALIIRGFTADSFITNDPGVNRGRNFTFSFADIMNSIHDWNDGDVPNGKKVVMILE